MSRRGNSDPLLQKVCRLEEFRADEARDLIVKFGQVLAFTHGALQAIYADSDRIRNRAARARFETANREIMDTLFEQRRLLLQVVSLLKDGGEGGLSAGGRLDMRMGIEPVRKICAAVNIYLRSPASRIKTVARNQGLGLARRSTAEIIEQYRDRRAEGLIDPLPYIPPVNAGAGAEVGAGAAAPVNAGAAGAAAPASVHSVAPSAISMGYGAYSAAAPALSPVAEGAAAASVAASRHPIVIKSSAVPAGSGLSHVKYVSGGKHKRSRKHKSKRHTKRKSSRK